MRDGGVEGPFRGEGAHMKLVKNELIEGHAPPRLISPVEVEIDDLRGAVNAERLTPRGRVWAPRPAVHGVPIERAGRGSVAPKEEVLSVASHVHGREEMAVRVLEPQLDLLGRGGPNAKLGAGIGHQPSPKVASEHTRAHRA